MCILGIRQPDISTIMIHAYFAEAWRLPRYFNCTPEHPRASVFCLPAELYGCVINRPAAKPENIAWSQTFVYQSINSEYTQNVFFQARLPVPNVRNVFKQCICWALSVPALLTLSGLCLLRFLWIYETSEHSDFGNSHILLTSLVFRPGQCTPPQQSKLA
jgi:hypothetical protein